jgi:hypothetical protein
MRRFLAHKCCSRAVMAAWAAARASPLAASTRWSLSASWASRHLSCLSPSYPRDIFSLNRHNLES